MMVLSKQLDELKLQQEADLSALRTQTRSALRAASPQRLIRSHPYICAGTAVVLGMTLAPGPRRGSSGKGSANASAGGGFFKTIQQLVAQYLPLLTGQPPAPPAAQDVPAKAAAAAPTPSPGTPATIIEIVYGIQTMLAALATMKASPSAPLDILISSAGTLDANSLAAHLNC